MSRLRRWCLLSVAAGLASAPTAGCGSQSGSHSSTGPLSDRATGGGGAAIQVVAGSHHTCALTDRGGVSCWGTSALGQVGDGDRGERLKPVSVPELPAATAIAAGGDHTCIITAEATVACWGYNRYGQLGDGTRDDHLRPVLTTGLADVVELALGANHTCARTRAGKVACWGYNKRGQLGDGTSEDRFQPTTVPGVNGAVSIAAGGATSAAILSDGQVVLWGWKGVSHLAGEGQYLVEPKPVPALAGAAQLAIANMLCARLQDGTVRCSGQDFAGLEAESIVQLVGLTGAELVAGGQFHACASTPGDLYCWGRNPFSQLGDGTTETRDQPAMVSGFGRARSLGLGGDHSCAINSGGQLHCWGRNLYGVLGDGTESDHSTPTPTEL